MSHELRAPLTNIIAVINILKGFDLSPSEKAEMLHALTLSANDLDAKLNILNRYIQASGSGDPITLPSDSNGG